MPQNKIPNITIHNVSTGEIITREMTEDELVEYQASIEAEKQRQIEAEAKAAARQAILDRLGLTEEEARLLLG